MKVVFNNEFGGFGLSDQAIQALNERKGAAYKFNGDIERAISRADEDLVAVVEALGAAAADNYAELAIAIIPDGAYWKITEYDGYETVHYTLTPPPEEHSPEFIVCYRKERR